MQKSPGFSRLWFSRKYNLMVFNIDLRGPSQKIMAAGQKKTFASFYSTIKARRQLVLYVYMCLFRFVHVINQLFRVTLICICNKSDFFLTTKFIHHARKAASLQTSKEKEGSFCIVENPCFDILVERRGCALRNLIVSYSLFLIPHPNTKTTFMLEKTTKMKNWYGCKYFEDCLELFRHLQQKIIRTFWYFSDKKAKVQPWNKVKLYRKAPILTQVFSALN